MLVKDSVPPFRAPDLYGLRKLWYRRNPKRERGNPQTGPSLTLRVTRPVPPLRFIVGISLRRHSAGDKDVAGTHLTVDMSSHHSGALSDSALSARFETRPCIMQRLATTLWLTLGIMLAGCNQQSGTNVSDSSGRYPRKTVTVICPWAAGGGTDRVARFWADALEKEFGQPFVVVNKTGGSGAVGHSAGAYARPDGHTITLITFELCTMHRMNICDLTYDDVACIMQMNADAAVIVVRDDARWKTLSEFLDHVKQNPGEVKMSGTATGGAWDLARAGLLDAAEVPIESVVWVPEKGAAPSLVQLLGGHIDAVCCSVPEALTQVEAGQLRMLAVMSDERHKDFPDVPTAKESGVEWTAFAWRGLALPKDTPAELVDTIYEKCSRIVESEEYKEFMRKNGFAIKVRAKDEFKQFLAEQDAQWNKVIETAGYAK